MHILPLSANEIEERLKKIPEIKDEIIDQEYLPNSTNALSGIAVTQAIGQFKEELDAELLETQQNKVTDLTADVSPEQYPTAVAVKSAIATAVTSNEQYTDRKIADLIATAPETLDTLNELATALGNDENFSTTVFTRLGELTTEIENVSGLVGDEAVQTQISVAINSTALNVLKPGDGEDTIVVNSGTATGKKAIAGGDSNESIINEILGYDVNNSLDSAMLREFGTMGPFISRQADKASAATGDLSSAYGVGNQSLTSSTTTFGIANQAGARGFYIHRLVCNDDYTITVYLNDTQAPMYKYQAPTYSGSTTFTWNTVNPDQVWTPTDTTLNMLRELAAGDFVSITLFKDYSFIGKIVSLTDLANGVITISNHNNIKTEDIESNTIYSGASGRDNASNRFEYEKRPFSFTISFPNKPDIGLLDIKFGSYAYGIGNAAAGSISEAHGIANIADGRASFVTGQENIGSNYSLVGGYKNSAGKDFGFVAGYANTVKANYGTAIGDQTIASGRRAFATGFLTEAGNTASAFGRLSAATGKGAHAEGIEAYSDLDSDGNAYPTTKAAVSIDSTEIEVGFLRDLAIGDAIVLAKNGSVSTGFSTTDCRRIVDIITVDSSTHKLIINSPFRADNYYEGVGAPADGIIPAKAKIRKAVGSTASGEAAHAEGSGTKATGAESHAQGQKTKATAWCAHAEGYETESSGSAAHVEGYRTVASKDHQHVQGRYNDPDDMNYAHILGGGILTSGKDWSKEDKVTRRNIHTIDWDGNARFEGKVYVGPKDNSKALVSTSDLDVALATRLSISNPTGTGYFSLNRKANTVIGGNSVAVGTGTSAKSPNSFAEGEGTVAGNDDGTGGSAHAEGYKTQALGAYSHAEGQETVASEIAAHAEGGSKDKDGNSIKASELRKFRTGETIKVTTAAGRASHAEGTATYAKEFCSHAEGFNTMAGAMYSHAEGYWSEAQGKYSHAEGLGTIAAVDGQHVQGRYNEINIPAEDGVTYAHIVGWGENSNKKNIHTLDTNGNAWFAGELHVGGTNYDDGAKVLTYDSTIRYAENAEMAENANYAENAKSADYAELAYEADLAKHADSASIADVAERVNWSNILTVPTTLSGYGITDAYDKLSIDSKLTTLDNNLSSKIVGRFTDTGYGGEIFNDYANNTAIGLYSHAEGHYTQAGSYVTDETGQLLDIAGAPVDSVELAARTGSYAHAEGYYTMAGGICSHAEGHLTVALYDHSHAEGYRTRAEGAHTHAEGHRTFATGNDSHAEGHHARALQNRSHAEGFMTVADSMDQHVQGVANVVDSAGKYLHIVGNGQVEAAGAPWEYDVVTGEQIAQVRRSNAHTLDWGGNAWFSGDLFVHGSSQTDTNAKRIPVTYSGTGTPKASLGSDGDIYIMYA